MYILKLIFSRNSLLSINKLFFLVFTTLFLTSCESYEKKSDIIINLHDWSFKSEQDDVWRGSKSPSVVHLDLWRHNVIGNPFYGTNEANQQWIGLQKWIYKTSFNKGDLDTYDKATLVFEGLDTYADVYLNGKLILKPNNMFRSWSIDLEGLLEDSNQLEIYFLPPEFINEEKANQLAYQLPDNRVFTRKAPYHFGWDWGPKFVTAGIWKPVYIRAHNLAEIKQVQWEAHNISEASAIVNGRVEVESFKDQRLSLKISSEGVDLEQEYTLKKGLNYIDVDFEIEQPKLWYPKGLGEPDLYCFKVDLLSEQSLLDTDVKNIGIRTIELVQDKDEEGKSFFFKVNGKPLFVKGANYIPQDVFLTRGDASKYEKLIESAVWANMNMLRVWGGGVYENDVFYDLCDKNGILVWQDFMFACAMYPGDKDFLDNVKQEVQEQVQRLRHHPSIALWCGNNEVDNGWKDWGWQKQFDYSTSDSTQISNDYQALFHKLIPEVLVEEDSLRPYHESSPTFGWGHEENFTQGDSHYWGVWWGHESFDVFHEKVGRFMSEYGFQSMPNMSTIRKFTDKDERYLFSKTLKSHQKHPTGYETILEYMKREYYVPQDLENFVYVSQMLQAEGMKTAIESHRRNQPHCMGTLYWQFNDCWPVSSWSSIDYNYNKKASHYAVRDAYKDLILSSYIQNDTLKVYGVSNNLPEMDYEVAVCQISFKGDTIAAYNSSIRLLENSSDLIFTQAFSEIESKTESYLVTRIIMQDALEDVSYLFFDKTVNLNLPKTQLNIEINQEKEAYQISLFSDVFVKDLALESNIKGEFSQNYFCLPAKQTKVIWFYPKEGGDLNLNYRSMVDMQR